MTPHVYASLCSLAAAVAHSAVTLQVTYSLGYARECSSKTCTSNGSFTRQVLAALASAPLFALSAGCCDML